LIAKSRKAQKNITPAAIKVALTGEDSIYDATPKDVAEIIAKTLFVMAFFLEFLFF
jgi:hypothetical protein